MVDALTEVVGVPHERGQTEVIIPEELRNYSKWVMSQEYQDRLKSGTSRTAAEPPQEHYRHQQAAIEHQPSASRTTGGATEGKHVEPEGLTTGFWNKIIETSRVSPSGEDPAFWPRAVFEKFEY